MKVPHPIPYQGSKRNLANSILPFFPNHFDRLIEPFAGSAAITIASAFHKKANQFVINDINRPLINLWEAIVNNPESVIESYKDIWHGQLNNQEAFYYHIRDIFNETQRPDYLLFLLAKCVKAAVRYNAQGSFNQSPDKRRLGRKPTSMGEDIRRVSQLLRGRIQFHSTDYTDIFNLSTPNDVIYMDPPYQGTGLNGGFNYAGNIGFDNFVRSLFDLNDRQIPFILSYDGRTGDKIHGNPLPENLNLTRIEINAGRSSQATLLQRDEITFESLYLSPALERNINLQEVLEGRALQQELFANYE